ncbi:LLM class F420-dependent oxidoreductase [Mycobacterium florentinum]|uniref:LLM class F420-dependent oxidoreductase n=1 Tax=Mycobacterium florentinum TaxID=292462 RepID=A0A1X1TTQ5_MYCFL|nr:TIGR03564 family F420-dependent LLM class oxidoreductase [Mycobacterium florentinum]MCV7408421.1 TIGR03564 family F420-dependent LLM class oxidoreductase [Mycobacterium florentinum]ORV47972.1 LLM class F420-dependent oxidoreductase [Mycobacterium florentinum]BBX78085.1 LLM class F420-dependent oxidoreductase [Mycobacterium florentinum]
MRISLITNLNNKTPIESCIRDLTQAREAGFARLWMTQMPFDVDLLTVLAAALREVPDIEVASGVVPIQNQHPSLLAQRALTLNIIGAGRFTLGIGVTHRAVTEGMWGISWDRSVKRLSEYLDGLLPLLAGEPADAPGELVTTRGALQIPNAPTPQVYVAALGPQMLRVAGKRTAGTITWMTGPKTLREHVGPTLRDAAAEAGRPDGSVAVAAALPVSVTDDVAKIRALAAEQFAMYGHLPSYRAMLDREGFSGPEDAALIGDESTVSQQLDGLRDAGVDEFVAIPFDPSPEGAQRTRACLRAWA